MKYVRVESRDTRNLVPAIENRMNAYEMSRYGVIAEVVGWCENIERGG